MAPDSTLDDLVAPLRDDNVSGASELSRTAADILRQAAVRVPAESLEELRDSLSAVGQRIMEAQPSMAPMVTLVREVLEAVENAAVPDAEVPRGEPGDDDSGAERSVEAARHAAARVADEFRAGLEARAEAVAEAAVDILPPGGTVGTISASGTVRRLLESEASPRGIRVICFESRPMREGRALAEALADAGIEVVYAVDAAIDSLAPECEVVIFGTDAVGDAGVTNKIGSKALARAAVESGVPVYVLADVTKLLPPGHPQIAADDRADDEIWPGAPAGVTIWNRYFEVVPMDLVAGVVTELGVMTAEELGELRAVAPPG